MPNDTITELLRRLSVGDKGAEEHLFRAVYRDLRRMAASHLRKERSDHTLQPTALVHEAYLRLVKTDEILWQNRTHFYRVAAGVMRRILVDHARSRTAEKRGGAQVRMPVSDLLAVTDSIAEVVLDVDRALTKLALLDNRQAKIVELRYFGGLSEEEIASVLQISTRTVKREWAMAKAWLKGELADQTL